MTVIKTYIYAYTDYITSLMEDNLTDEIRSTFLKEAVEADANLDVIFSEVFCIFANKFTSDDETNVSACINKIRTEYDALLSNIYGDFSKWEKFFEKVLLNCKSDESITSRYFGFIPFLEENTDLDISVKYAVSLLVLRNITLLHLVRENIDKVKKLMDTVRSCKEEPAFSKTLIDIMFYSFNLKTIG